MNTTTNTKINVGALHLVADLLGKDEMTMDAVRVALAETLPKVAGMSVRAVSAAGGLSHGAAQRVVALAKVAERVGFDIDVVLNGADEVKGAKRRLNALARIPANRRRSITDAESLTREAAAQAKREKADRDEKREDAGTRDGHPKVKPADTDAPESVPADLTADQEAALVATALTRLAARVKTDDAFTIEAVELIDAAYGAFRSAVESVGADA